MANGSNIDLGGVARKFTLSEEGQAINFCLCRCNKRLDYSNR